jgi:hypothetical protein
MYRPLLGALPFLPGRSSKGVLDPNRHTEKTRRRRRRRTRRRRRRRRRLEGGGGRGRGVEAGLRGGVVGAQFFIPVLTIYSSIKFFKYPTTHTHITFMLHSTTTTTTTTTRSALLLPLPASLVP